MRTSRLLLIGSAAVALGLVFGGIASGVFRQAGTPSSVPDVRSSAGTRVTLARFGRELGTADRQLVLQRTPDGFICLWDSPDASGERGVGGCNSASDPLGGRKLFISLAYDGGPDVKTVTDARLSGLLAVDVARVAIEMSDGTTRTAPALRGQITGGTVGPYRVFAYRIRQADLRAGATPVAVAALDATGNELDRQTTGIGP